DRFGLMMLDLPAKCCPAGAPLTLTVVGDSAASAAWYMTFTGPVRQEVLIQPSSLLLRNQGHPVQPVRVEVIFLHPSGRVVLRPEGGPEQRHRLHFGRNTFTLLYPPVAQEASRTLQVELGGEVLSQSFVLKPVRPWEIYFVQHTHTDIGYTRPQTDILAEHLRYLDFALDYCDQTDALPDEARFRWTCETAWAVREYLKCRPSNQIARLKQRVQEGRIEVTAMLLNWAEVADENALLHSLEAVRSFREAGLPVETAMQDDVNGFAWCLVDYLHDLGIRYVTSGINDARALKPFAVPTAFWWESPAGKRVLAFRADHYMTGNMIGLTGGGLERLEDGLPRYLERLAADGYRMNRVSLQYSGYYTDNAPPSTGAAEIIRQWNEKYLYPHLRNATVHEFLTAIEREEGADLPVLRVAWPDWWTDGYGCAMRETAAGRATQAGMVVNKGLLAMAQLLGAALPEAAQRQAEAVMENLHFYNEHTFGAAESISDPLAENSQVQWSEKASYVWQAVMGARLLRETALGQLQALLPPAGPPLIAVYNTLNWPRSGLVTLFVDNQILPRDKAFRILDDGGREAAVQLLASRAEGCTWTLWAEEIPALGCRTYRIVAGEQPAPLAEKFVPAEGIIENGYYRAELDARKGTLRSLLDLELGLELLDPQREWDLGALIYERLQDRRALEELRLGPHTRTALKNVRIEPGTDGPIWQSIRITGECDGFGGTAPVSCELRFYKKMKQIELLFRARKLAVTDPEAVYVAFPFALPEGSLLFEAQGGVVRPGENQLEGTASDWNTVQNFAALHNGRAQIVLVSDDIPLMQFGGINTGRYQRAARPLSQQIFSWVLNNYWTTNFRAAQEGEISWSYQFTSGTEASDESAARFGWSRRLPLVARVLPAAGQAAGLRTALPPPVSLWPFKPAPVLLVSAQPAKEGVLLHLRELSGRVVRLEWQEPGTGWQAEACNPFGEPLADASDLALAPLEVKFIRLWRQGR
ncbi:MAG TPA: glycoside hydrolase family 38 C-terminal domain-containing protein, partial [bacterium]|nr:glycoside hydrolase family 38 C-terminal domain-containing protein [bacterium]